MRFLALLLALAGTAATVLAQEPIKIGEFASMTGGNAGFGQQSHKGTQLAIDEINAAGGVLGPGTLTVGAPADLVLCLEKPSIPLANYLMSSCDLTLATGGPAMVKAAYGSGKPAYGVGAGNATMVIDETADQLRSERPVDPGPRGDEVGGRRGVVGCLRARRGDRPGRVRPRVRSEDEVEQVPLGLIHNCGFEGRFFFKQRHHDHRQQGGAEKSAKEINHV